MVKIGSLGTVPLVAFVLATALVVGTSIAQSQTDNGAESGDSPSAKSSLELLREQEERRAREEKERREYLAETDALLRSIRSQIFEIELTIAEIDYVLENFECAAAESFERQIETKMADLGAWQSQVEARCATVSPRNEDAQAICQSQLGTTRDQLAYYNDIKGRSLRACEPEAGPGTATDQEEGASQ